jgi:hypothetical protein
LRKACNAAKSKTGKEGYILMYRLLGTVFSVNEMAISWGQGIGNRKDEDLSRPVLDRAKIKVLKGNTIHFTKLISRV